MIAGTLEDLNGTISVVAFQSEEFESIAEVFQDDNIVSVHGRVRMSQDRTSINCERITLINDMLRPKHIHLDVDDHQALDELDDIESF